MIMEIRCLSCYQTAPDRYMGTFRSDKTTDPQECVEIEMECPMVPGQMYEILLKGIFPPSNIQGRCVSDMVALNLNGTTLRASDK